MKLLQIATLILISCSSVLAGGEDKKLGHSKHPKLIHFADGMFTDDCLTHEIGQRIKLNGQSTQIKAINLYLFDSPRDSMTFKIRLYDIKEGKPGSSLLPNPIVQTHAIKEGWLKLDLSNLNIELSEDFVVAIEVNRTPDEPRNINYEVLPLRGGKSYYRIDGQTEWKRPPHGYRMYVDAVES